MDDLEMIDLQPTGFPDTELGDYQEFAESTRDFNVGNSPDRRMELIWATVGLSAEAGEVAGVVEKMLRKDRSQEEVETAVLDEVGDVLWYCAAICNALGRNLDEVVEHNLDKITRRREASRS